MSLIQALILGAVQGLTEFIPISSDGHLTIVPFIIGWEESPSLAFDVALHIGTLLALAWVFRDEVAMLIRTVLRWKEAPESDRRIVTLVVIASVPAAVIGFTLEALIEGTYQRPVLASFLLGVTGWFLISSEAAAEAREDEGRTDEHISRADSAIIGAMQALAVLPGISRSGMTIGTGLRLGLTRRAAARFSFLISIPIIFGAILVQIPDMLDEGLASAGAGSFLVGIAASGVTGLFAVRWFLGVVERRGLRPFGAYCFVAMIAGLLTALARG